MDLNTLVTILLFALTGWFIYKRVAPVKGLVNLTGEQLSKKLTGSKRNNMLIDVREPREFNTGHIDGAVNIPLSKLKHRLGEIPMNKELILYCQSGMRSKQAARTLRKQKLKDQDIYHLPGGISSWSGRKKSGNK